jgi:hypothetical protein
VTSWGYTLERRTAPYIDIARELVAKELPERIKKPDDLLASYNKELVEVVADSLRYLWAHTMTFIINKIGLDSWEEINLKIILIIPAI